MIYRCTLATYIYCKLVWLLEASVSRLYRQRGYVDCYVNTNAAILHANMVFVKYKVTSKPIYEAYCLVCGCRETSMCIHGNIDLRIHDNGT